MKLLVLVNCREGREGKGKRGKGRAQEGGRGKGEGQEGEGGKGEWKQQRKEEKNGVNLWLYT